MAKKLAHMAPISLLKHYFVKLAAFGFVCLFIIVSPQVMRRNCLSRVGKDTKLNKDPMSYQI